jgi:hypothetical protein
MGLTLESSTEKLPGLLARGFPPADETTGNYDLDAIDVWRRSRHPQLFPINRRNRRLQPLVRQARSSKDDLLERFRRSTLVKPKAILVMWQPWPRWKAWVP